MSGVSLVSKAAPVPVGRAICHLVLSGVLLAARLSLVCVCVCLVSLLPVDFCMSISVCLARCCVSVFMCV